MNETKPWWQSKTELLGYAGALYGALALFDVLPAGLDLESIVEGVLVLVGIGTALFRHFATAKIAPVTTP